MIADTTFLSDFLKEKRRQTGGPASDFFARHRAVPIRTTIITAAEIAVLFKETSEAFAWLARWKIYPLHNGIAAAAADIDRQMIATGRRLGENDNWIAGFAAYHREPLISDDLAFDRAPGVRRVNYQRKS
jgi:predicted nucleic acid-binding protein